MPQNHYSVLALPPSAAQSPSFQAALRRAYKVALLNAHPDKRGRGGPPPPPPPPLPPTGYTKPANGDAGVEKAELYTVDDVKEALAVLSDPTRRADFERWLRVRGGGGEVDGEKRGGGEDFVLGLESLDLSDFEAGMPFVRIVQQRGGRDDEGEDGDGDGDGEEEEADGEEEGGEEEEQMTWTRACRCGDEEGFKILERELEEAERRGEREVLVGCEGCSLWVRVGFDVEEG